MSVSTSSTENIGFAHPIIAMGRPLKMHSMNGRRRSFAHVVPARVNPHVPQASLIPLEDRSYHEYT